MAILQTLNKNRGFATLLTIYIILFLADMGITIMNSQLLPYLELNPLYWISGSIIPIILANILAICLLWAAYFLQKSTVTNRFLALSAMMSVILLRIVALRNHYKMLHTSNALEIAKTIPVEVVKQQAAIYGLILYLPIAFALVTFLFWKWDHTVRKKDEIES